MGKAVYFERFGGPEVLQISDVPDEQPANGQVRLKVRAIGVNRTELTLRSGRSPRQPQLPSRIGFEAAGIIDEVGAEVSGFERGDRVALIPTYGAAQFGLYGESSLAPAQSLVKLLDTESFEEAAATWVAFGTAWSGLHFAGDLKPSQTVAITAASSNVGIAAIQVARLIGARPIAVTRTSAKKQALLDRGAEYVVTLDTQQVEMELRRLTDNVGVDMVLDAVGGSGLAQLMKGTRDGGRILLYGALDTQPTLVSPFDIFGRDVRLQGFSLPTFARDPKLFEQLRDAVRHGLREGALKPEIARTFRLEDIVAAHRFMEAKDQLGKVVITV